MKQSNNLLGRLTSATDLDTEAVPGQPLVELSGTNRVLIENHLGILQYCDTRICVKLVYGSLCVAGNGLELARMTKEQLVITGDIAGICVHKGRQ